MPGLSKVIVLDPDVRAGRQIQLGFQREGIPAEAAEVPRDLAELALPAAEAGVVIVVGGEHRGLELVRHARRCLDEADVDTPIVFAGRGVRRTDAEAAGADEVLLPPTYLRDIVTIGRLLKSQPAPHRDHLVGTLGETTGVLTLVRALAALGRSAVLTLIRGLRRGEVRFYHGEVTSAHVGLSHGQAALHQLLLWTEARFDFQHEDIVRRHQIPLDRDELFADAERFLTGVRESSGSLSPSMVLEQDAARLQSLVQEIPMEVHGVLRMFDGHRVLADVLEDSPYRLFETLRVTHLALEAGLLRQSSRTRPRPTWRPVLAIEEWLIGDEPQGEVREQAAGDGSGSIPRAAADSPSGRARSGPNRSKGSRRRRKKRRSPLAVAVAAAAAAPAAAAADPAATPAAATAKQEIDWGALVPRTVGAEVGPLACVVPASQASGEITLPAREPLEEQADGRERDRSFPVETVFWDETADLERERADLERERAAEEAQLETDARDAREAAALVSRLGAAFGLPRTPAESAPAAVSPAELAAAAAAPAESLATMTTEPMAAPPVEEPPAIVAEPPAIVAEPPAVVAEPPAVVAEPPAVVAEPPPAEAPVAAESTEAPVAEAAPAPIGEPAPAPVAETEPAPAPVAEPRPSEPLPPAEPPPAEPPPAPAAMAAPITEFLDEPSDGVIRQAIYSAEAAPALRRPPPGEIPEDDRPEDATGEIVTDTQQRPAVERPADAEPSILVADLASEPSVLGADLAAAPAAVATVADAKDAVPPPSGMATPVSERTVAEVSDDDADAFSDLEEDFFRTGQDRATKPHAVHIESFDDLDEDYQPVGFWDRLLGRKPKP